MTMFKQLILATTASLLMSISFIAAFSIHPSARSCEVTRPSAMVLFAARDGTELESVMTDGTESSAETMEVSPKVSVKCPDCDLCDGSGRCVMTLFCVILMTLF